MERTIKKFRIGDKVVWWSGGGSTERKKVGFVVAVVPPFEDPLKYVPPSEASDQPKQRVLFRGRRRNHESYLVLSCFDVYWPLVKNLQHHHPIEE